MSVYMDEAINFGNALAEFAVTAVPAENDSFSRLALLNWLGCAIAGARETGVDLFASFYEEENPCGTYVPIGRRTGVSPAACAAIDCMSSTMFAYDDIHFPTSLHPCGPVASAILALARTQKVSVDEALCALKIGMEVEVRTAEVIFSQGTGADRGWYSTGIAGGIGAAAAVGRLLGLDAEHMKYALGLAAAMASGTRGMHTAMSFCLAPARAAESGYMAAKLAQKGFSCQIKSLSGPNSLITLLAPRANFAVGTENLGKKYHCEETVCKIYPFGFVAYAAINCADELRAYTAANKKDISSVVLSVSPVSKRLGGSQQPENVYDSLVCLRYITAGVLTTPGFSRTPISYDFSIPDDISAVMERVDVDADETLDDKQAQITAIYTDGSSFSYRCDNAPGSEKLPPAENEIIEKFFAQASSYVSRERAAQLKEAIFTSSCDDITSLLV